MEIEMEEKKLTDEEIVKALEDMASECETNFSASVVDFIHRQKAEIERLTEELANYIRKAGFYYKKCKEYGIECFHDNDLEVD